MADASHSPDLPPALEEEFYNAYFGAASEHRQSAIDAVRLRHPEHADALQELCARLDAGDELMPTQISRDPDSDLAPGHKIGQYTILQKIGEGGFGIVYLAAQTRPVQRRVALKLIRPGMDSRSVLARFEAEQQALALMDHPNIAHVFEAGVTDRGRSYFALEYVAGVPIHTYCDQNKLDVRARLQLFLKACHGVQHSHQRGIIHRDLKPSNILVSDTEGGVELKLIDFGIAKALGPSLTDRTLHTEIGRMIGTPEYMSPEQARGGAQGIDTRTDVYSLGVVLYQLLVGDLPFDREELRSGSHEEIQRIITESEPTRPSSRVATSERASTQAERRHVTVHSLARQLRGDLDWIILRAMAKEAHRRYATVSEFAADITRHLNNEPVLAMPPSASYRIGKFIRRHRATAAAASAILLALIAGLLAMTYSARVARAAEGREREARQQAERDRGLALAAREESEAAKREAEKNLANFQLLAQVVLLEEAKADYQELFPATPDKLPGMRAWMKEQAKPLVAALPDLERRLTALAAKGTKGADGKLTFSARENRFLYDTLTGLVENLRAFGAEKTGLLARVAARIRDASTLEEETVGRHATRWSQAIAAVQANPRYENLKLVAQIGLIPLGADPQSKLEEFAHLRSAPEGRRTLPTRDADGRLQRQDFGGLIFVLLPPGRFKMGAQSEDDGSANYDPAAMVGEGPVHDVILAPFFLSKFEMNREQWHTLAGDRPSKYPDGRKLKDGTVVNKTHPVENVSWQACADLMRQQAMQLPTEAQWEYACRAGTDTVWFTGSRPESLAGHANVADRTAKEHATSWQCTDLFADGWVPHAPVGSFKPNRFGLHDTHGNVWEWCRDALAPYDQRTPRAGDGLRRAEGDRRILRGGAFFQVPEFARSAKRMHDAPVFAGSIAGLRPAIELQK